LLRFLKQGVGLTYVEVFDVLLERVGVPVRETLVEIVAGIEGVHLPAARALLEYETMLAEFRGDEVEEELVNVYRQPAIAGVKPHFLVADLDIDVVTMVSDPRTITWTPELSCPIIAVVFRTSEAEVSTVRLTPAQAEIFEVLMPLERDTREAVVAKRAPGRPRDVATVVAGLCARIDASPDAPDRTPPVASGTLLPT
jgi:hypothetical protein